jgi:hypothetical protein
MKSRPKLDSFEEEVKSTGRQDGLLGAPPHAFLRVIDTTVEARAEEWLPTRADVAGFARRIEVARERVRAAKAAVAGQADLPPARLVPIRVAGPALVLVAGVVAAAGVAAPVELPMRALVLVAGGALVALVALALAVGPAVRHQARRQILAGRETRAEAVLAALEDEECVRADEAREKARFVALETARLEAIYAFHREARGELAAVEQAMAGAVAHAAEVAVASAADAAA